jgi:hypothetical protein
MSPHRIPPWLSPSRLVLAGAVGVVVAMGGLYYVGAFISGTPSRPPSAVITSRLPSPTNHPFIDPFAAAGFRIVVVAATQAAVSGDVALATAYTDADSRTGSSEEAFDVTSEFGDVYSGSRLRCRCWAVVMVDVRLPLCPLAKVAANLVYLVDGKSGAIVSTVSEPASIGQTFGSCSGASS